MLVELQKKHLTKKCQYLLFKRLDIQTQELYKDKYANTIEKSDVLKEWRCPQVSKLQEITDPFHGLESEYDKGL